MKPGLLRLAMTSLLDEAGLSALQSDSIILATLGFMPSSNDGSFTYLAPAGFAGEVSFTYKASDGVFDSLEATVVVRVGDYGDLNGDGAVDSADVALLMSLIGTDVDDAMLTKADLNADGVVDALDARMLTWMCSKPLCAR